MLAVHFQLVSQYYDNEKFNIAIDLANGDLMVILPCLWSEALVSQECHNPNYSVC